MRHLNISIVIFFSLFLVSLIYLFIYCGLEREYHLMKFNENSFTYRFSDDFNNLFFDILYIREFVFGLTFFFITSYITFILIFVKNYFNIKKRLIKGAEKLKNIDQFFYKPKEIAIKKNDAMKAINYAVITSMAMIILYLGISLFLFFYYYDFLTAKLLLIMMANITITVFIMWIFYNAWKSVSVYLSSLSQEINSIDSSR